MKKVLMVACVPSMIGQFNMANIELLQKLGCQVGVACDFKDRTVWNKERVYKFLNQLKEKGISFYQIDFTRSAWKISRHFRAYKQLKKLIQKESYEMIHCHTPVAAAIARIAAHQTGKKVIYTAHGFHFFQGAPLKNWMLYYPVEKFLSRWTDCLITINKEDYKRAKKKFYAKRTEYVPGVGVDTQKFSIPDENLEIKEWKKSMIADSSLVQDYEKVNYLLQECNKEESNYRTIRQEKRKELGFKEDDFVIVSVGELNANKNHRVIIEAVKRLNDKKLKYIICGIGELKEELEEFIKKEKLEEQVFLLGYREDIREILWAGDLFAFPSKREGLSVALMEAMASGIPCIASDIRGNRDLFGKEEKKYLVTADNLEAWKKEICYFIKHHKEKIQTMQERSKKMNVFSIQKITKKMKKIYKTVLEQ